MKKRKILLTSLLAISAFSALSAGIIIKNSLNNENKDKEDINDNLKENTFVESPEACDDEFGGGSDILLSPQTITYNSLNSDVVDALYSPKLGYQYSYNSANHTVSIRFTAAITSLNVKAVWTRTAYDSEGNVVKATKNVEVTNAYRGITENDSTITYATNIEVGGEHPYNYFVCYTIRNIPTDNEGNALYKIDASLTISQDENKTSTDTGSVNASETPSENESYSYQLDFDDTYTYKSNKNTSAGNGQYIAGKVKTIYSTSDTELNTDYLTVNVNKTTSSATTTMPIYYDDFSSYGVTFTGFEAGVAGEQSINVNYGNATKAYKIYVVNTEAYVDSEGNYVVTVDQNYDGVIGAVDANNLSKGNMFKTIGQALEFLQNSSFVNQNSNKILNIGAGYYYEKLEINTPNLTINGAGSTTGTYYKDANNKDVNYDPTTYSTATIIEYDTLYGDYCDGIVSDDETKNHKHTTESTQTVAVRESATNCKINNITISNANNCKEYFIANYGSNNVEHRALAILIQADQFVMNDSSLLGYQDTIQLFTGRQYLYNTYISGATDYIFGTNNITLFDHCIIHTISTGSSNGGYITAFKGTNNDNNQGVDSPDYGVVFKSCTIEADSGVSNVALGRPWKLYANVAYIGCVMDSSVSKTAYDESTNPTQGARYVAWNSTSGPYPTSSTVKFVEYGNTGAGALEDEITGMTMLTENESKKYYDYSVIFGKKNGKVTFDLAWDPINGLEEDSDAIQVTTGFTYKGSSYSGTNVKNHNDGTNDAALISGTLDKVTYNTAGTNNGSSVNNWLKFNTGNTITFDVADQAELNICFYQGNNNAVVTLDGTPIQCTNHSGSGDQTRYTYELTTAGTVVITASSNGYLGFFEVNFDVSYDTRTLESLSVEGEITEFVAGNTFTTGDIVVRGNYSDGTKKIISDYTIDTSDVVMSTSGVYTVTINYGNISTSYDITVVAPSVDKTISTSTVLDFTSSTNVSHALSNSKIDYTNASINSNGDNASFSGYLSFEVKAGALIFISPYKTYGNYNVIIDELETVSSCTGDYSFTATSDCEITISANGQNYISQIGIIYPIVEDTTINFGEANRTTNKSFAFEGKNGVVDSVYINATSGKFSNSGRNDQYAQINANTTIKFKVAENATVSYNLYSTNFTYSINGGTATAVSEATGSFTVEDGGEVTITCTSNSYIVSITVSY